MGCCVGRNKIEPLPSFENTKRKVDTVVRSSLPRIRNSIPPKSEKVRVHRSIDLTYTICSTIGRGAFGHVIRVEHNATKKPYAIKIIDLSRDYFEHEKKSEIEILRTVNHKYVIKLHEVISAPGKLYLVMDLATGGELFDRIYQLGYFDEDQAFRVLSMILKGIKYLHSVGITHRDLKPENILYYHPGKNSRIIITDFGLATIRKSENSLMNTDCGTVEYMAPEVIMKDPYTNSVDMWSTGVITYVLLSGQMPFSRKGDPINRVLKRICFGTYSYIGKVTCIKVKRRIIYIYSNSMRVNTYIYGSASCFSVGSFLLRGFCARKTPLGVPTWPRLLRINLTVMCVANQSRVPV